MKRWMGWLIAIGTALCVAGCDNTTDEKITAQQGAIEAGIAAQVGMPSILNSYLVSLAYALGISASNFFMAALGWCHFTYDRACWQSIIVTLLLLTFTTIGKLAIWSNQ